MTEILPTPPDDLPPLPDYWAHAEDPRKVAAPYNHGLTDLYISHGGDGLPLALAPRLNGYTRGQIGDGWHQISGNLSVEARRQAARSHVAEHFDLSATGVTVPPAEDGVDALAYARHVLRHTLVKPTREEDTDVRLRTRYPYIVPGTRFDDPFPADNVHVAFGLLADGHISESLETTANTEHDTMRFGYAANFSKLAMLRQQTPIDSFAMEATRGFYGNEALRHWRDAIVRNINFMQEGKEKLAGLAPHQHGAHRRIGRLPLGLYAYRNYDDTPVDYKLRSVIRVESAEKDRETGEKAIAGIRDEDERAHIWDKVQRSLAAGAESWQDMSDYQLEDRIHLETTRTIDIYTSWMQAAVAHKLKLAAEASEALGEYGVAEHYWSQFNELKQVVGLMFRQTGKYTGHHTDLLLDGSQTGALNAAQILPLLVGHDFIPYDHALMTINLFLEKLVGDYGLHTSDIIGCPEQWTGEIDWPSLANLAMLASMEQAREAKRRNIPGQSPEPFIKFAEEIKQAMRRGIKRWHAKHKTLPERINGTSPAEIALGGEYCSKDEEGNDPEPQVGFAMTAGAFIVAETLSLRDIFEQANPDYSWLSQCFAIHIGRPALTFT